VIKLRRYSQKIFHACSCNFLAFDVEVLHTFLTISTVTFLKHFLLENREIEYIGTPLVPTHIEFTLPDSVM